MLARLTSPWVAIPLWTLATWVWAIPSVFDYTAQHPVVHAFEHATLFYTGLAMWWLIIDPLPRARLRPNGERLALLGFTRLASACVCLPLTWLSATEYPLYASAPRAYGLSAINDQHLAGAAMCFVEFLVFGIAFAAVFISMLGRDDSRVTLAEYAAAARHLPTRLACADRAAAIASAAAGVVAAAATRVAGARALHHAAALAARRAEVEALQPRRDDRRRVGERGRRGARAAVAASRPWGPFCGAADPRRCGPGGVGGDDRLGGLLGGLAGAHLGVRMPSSSWASTSRKREASQRMM